MLTEQQKIGELIRTKRKEKHLTQAQLAEKINITRDAIFTYEKGKVKVIPFSNRVKLAEALDIPIESLFYDVEAPQKTIIYPDDPNMSIGENKLVEFIAKTLYSQRVYESMDNQLKVMFPNSTEAYRNQIIDRTRNHVVKILIDKSDSDNLRILKEMSTTLGLNWHAPQTDDDTKK